MQDGTMLIPQRVEAAGVPEVRPSVAGTCGGRSRRTPACRDEFGTSNDKYANRLVRADSLLAGCAVLQRLEGD